MSYAEEYARELIENTYSDEMMFPTALFVIAILVAVSSVLCFVLAPLYSKGRNGGAKTAGRIISIFDFILGILLIVACMVIVLLIAMASSGDLSVLGSRFQRSLIGLVYAPMRFGMSIKSTYDNPCDTSIAFYALYLVTAGILGIIAFIVSSVSVKKFRIANGMVIRGAAAPAGAPAYNPYQPYGTYGQNPQQIYANNVQNAQPTYANNVQNAQPTYTNNVQNAQPTYANNVQNTQPTYGSYGEYSNNTYGEYGRSTYGVYGQNTVQPNVQAQTAVQENVQPQTAVQGNAQPQTAVQVNAQPQTVVQENAQTQNTVQTASPSYCNICGQQLKPGIKFCPRCGNRLM